LAGPYAVRFTPTDLFIFFAVFFIIPGLLFEVWPMFMSHIVMIENQNWRPTLAVSRDYAQEIF